MRALTSFISDSSVLLGMFAATSTLVSTLQPAAATFETDTGSHQTLIGQRVNTSTSLTTYYPGTTILIIETSIA